MKDMEFKYLILDNETNVILSESPHWDDIKKYTVVHREYDKNHETVWVKKK